MLSIAQHIRRFGAQLPCARWDYAFSKPICPACLYSEQLLLLHPFQEGTSLVHSAGTAAHIHVSHSSHGYLRGWQEHPTASKQEAWRLGTAAQMQPLTLQGCCPWLLCWVLQSLLSNPVQQTWRNNYRTFFCHPCKCKEFKWLASHFQRLWAYLTADKGWGTLSCLSPARLLEESWRGTFYRSLL